ncbi:MAG: ribonuclease Z, partial [Candidatus Aenigmarchaeota archaeon]|nr:ribonuclease Z [Candidatus Aenigmarchaeota archaeon]
IDRIFISHWHADHFAGLLGLVQTMSLENRTEPLYVYGPIRSKEFADQLLNVGYFEKKFDVIVRELEEGDVVDCGEYDVVPFCVKHRIPAIGYVFKEKYRARANMNKAAKLGLKTSPLIGDLKAGKIVKHKGVIIKPEDILDIRPGRKIVYTGDTKYTDNIARFSTNADVLICDSTFSSDFETRAIDFMHTTSRQAGKIAKKAKVKKLILTHISRRYQETNDGEAKLLAEAKKEFKNTTLAKDFMVVNVK